MTAPKIRLQGVRKKFGAKVVLDGVDLDVMAGESVVIIGGSGSGKSVTLKCILGLMTPDAGEIAIDGEPVIGVGGRERERINAKIGMLFQSAALFDSLTVWENAAFGLIAGKGMSRREARPVAMEMLARVGLDAKFAMMSPADLSGGMRKRVGLARAIAIEPEILFFDEPTTGIDPIMGDIINELIVKCTEETGATALTITHDMASARKISDRIAMLYKGKIVWAGPTGEIDRADNGIVQQFINGRAEGPIEIDVRRL
ncbi:MAG: ATP-binding cassette domain-containing protein [Alphaproteobacteria bacterium]|nr:ATP-binding cassette domain-containing protein [Alphaproteobacteria bacterium]